MSENPDRPEGRPSWANRLREEARDIFMAGVAAADPEKAVERVLHVREGALEIARDPLDPRNIRSAAWKRVFAVSFGKAATAMARAAGRILPPELLQAPGIAVTNYENAEEVARFRVLPAGHPLPDANGVAAAKAAAEAVEKAGEGDLVLVLISGGGSALLPYPAEGLTLEDKIATTCLLLASGADIGEMNAVRKHLSRLKGGGLARLAAPADLHALILSDVLGDDLSAIASGPTVPDPTTYRDTVAILKRRGVWEKAPAAVRSHLENGAGGGVPETPKPGDKVFDAAEATLVGSNGMSLEAAESAAGRAGRRVELWRDRLCGEARVEAEKWAHAAGDALNRCGGAPFAMVAGGETTVTLTGKGRGGRNQEMALAFAIAAEKADLPRRWVFLSGGTDGRDGPTDAAGGVVDPWSLERMRNAGVDARVQLDDNNSYEALKAAGDLLITGATGTNVADLQVLLFA